MEDRGRVTGYESKLVGRGKVEDIGADDGKVSGRTWKDGQGRNDNLGGVWMKRTINEYSKLKR